MSNHYVVATSDASSDITAEAVSGLLRHARMLLDMDIAFVSEFTQGGRIFRHVETDPNSIVTIEVGQSNPLEETYCQRIVDGRLPRVITDTSLLPEAAALDVTTALRIRAYLAAPIVLSDGQVFGTVCCISHQTRTALGNRQIDALQTIADRVAAELQKNLLMPQRTRVTGSNS
jgi:GAF domain-containing protein